MVQKQPFKGAVLRPHAGTELAFQKAWRDLVDEMTSTTKRELQALFKSPEATSLEARVLRELQDAPAIVMDALNLPDLAERLMQRLTLQFTTLFDRAAEVMATRMVNATLADSKAGVERSLRGLSQTVTLQMTPAVETMAAASVAESVSLIKRVPADYLPKIQGDVMRSITNGNGLQDLIPALDKANVKVKNWSNNVALDQTRKAYNNINKARMQGVGIKKFEWIHGGGSNKPRKYHLDSWPAGLNGGIFRFDDPPVIDENTGERGTPGQLPYCGCTMRPVIEFDDED